MSEPSGDVSRPRVKHRKNRKRGEGNCWGNTLQQEKDEDIIRIVLNNVNSLGQKRKSKKEVEIREFMRDYDINIIGMTEIGFHGGRVRNIDTMYERTGAWFENRRCTHAYNTHDIPSKSSSQYGGVSLVARNEITHRWREQGNDTSGLGRWSWMRFSGKQHCCTLVITAYCPNPSKQGATTVYSQHLRHLNSDPINAFWEDLKRDILQWKAQGDRIVLMGDWNRDMNLEMEDWLKDTDLVDPIRAMHGEDSPPTYNGGSKTIDAILVSPDIIYLSGGYLSFGFLPGDHRGLWMDITVQSFIGYNPPPVPFANARRLQMKDPRCIKRYQKILHSLFENQGIYTRMYRLLCSIENETLTHEQAREFEAIDVLAEKFAHIAESKCRKLKMGGKKFSPAFKKAEDTINLWTLVRRRKIGRNVGARTITRLQKKLGIENTLLSIDEVNAKLDDAFKAYKIVAAQDEQLQLSYREDLAQARAKEGKLSAATELRNLNLRERARDDSRRRKSALGQNRSQGTSKIHVQGDKPGEIIEITDPEKMNEIIGDSNNEKFHQTETHCPLLKESMVESLGLIGDGPDVEDVLNGTYVAPPGTNEATRKWLAFMSRDDNYSDTTYPTVTLKDYRDGWKRMDEKTASGKTHFGHFKAGCLHKQIGWFLYCRSTIPFLTGYSPFRWRQGTDVMLLKKVHTYFVDKLRTIVLYEADYNHENKRLGRHGITMAIEQNKISREQFCRPGRSAQDNVLAKRLTFDYVRLTKQPMGMSASDLKSCYDRIVHTAASIALQRIGIPLKHIQTMFGTVQRLVHKIRTLFGDSVFTYGGDDHSEFLRPAMGTGQGSGSAPTIWSILSSTIFDILHLEGYSTSFIFALSLGIYQLCGFSYVDDCDLVVIQETAKATAMKLQEVLNLWDSLMEVTGAALAPDKCWWYLTDFSWKNGVWKMKDADVDNFQLTARDKDHKIIPLRRLKYNEAEMMLGVYLAPDGNQTRQIKYMTEKATKWKNSILASKLDHRSTWLTFKITILKTFQYPLVATSLTEAQMKDLLNPVLRVALPRSGIARNFPRAVLYGPIDQQGLGITNLYDSQYARHVRDIVYLPWQNAACGNLLRANLEGITLEAGIQGPLFEYMHHIDWLNTTYSFVADTHSFCVRNNIKFNDGYTYIPSPRRNDVAIMDIFRQHRYSKSIMKSLNRCRIYLRVYFLSDIADGTGTKIKPEALDFSLCQFTRNRYHWPNQSKPPKKDRDLWINTIRVCFAPCHDRLITPLGPWQMEKGQYYSSWNWFVSTSKDLYFLDKGSWYSVPPSPSRTTRQSTRRLSYMSDKALYLPLPSTPTTSIQRCTVQSHTSGHLILEGSAENIAPPLPNITFPRSQDGFIECIRFSANVGWILQHIQFHCNILDLVDSFVRGDLVFVSDGSYFPDYLLGSMAWCIATTSGQIMVSGGGLIPGNREIQSAYRSEAGGLLAITTIISHLEIFTQHRSPDTPYIVACDGESALYQSLICSRDNITPSSNHFDILSHVHDLRRKLLVTIVPTHVKGHQDEQGRDLTVLEYLNTRVDILAKKILTHCHSRDIQPLACLPVSPSIGMPTISIDGDTIHSQVEQSITTAIAKKRILRWWTHKLRIPPGHENIVDWKVSASTMKELPLHLQKFVPKWVTSFIAVGKTMSYRQQRQDNSCPRCGRSVEDTTHVLRCRESRKEWIPGVKGIVTWLEQVDTDPNLVYCIKDILLYWQRRPQNSPQYCPPIGCATTMATIQAQLTIGWKGFLEGLLAVNWAKQQQLYYHNIGSRRTGHRWAVGLSTRIWKLIYTLWNKRNMILHMHTCSEKRNGSDHVRIACQQELLLGPTDLSSPYHSYFNISSEDLAKRSSYYQRHWLSITRNARELVGHVYTDYISTDKSIRKWIGLHVD